MPSGASQQEGDKWEHASCSAGLGGASTHFIQTLNKASFSAEV